MRLGVDGPDRGLGVILEEESEALRLLAGAADDPAARDADACADAMIACRLVAPVYRLRRAVIEPKLNYCRLFPSR